MLAFLSFTSPNDTLLWWLQVCFHSVFFGWYIKTCSFLFSWCVRVRCSFKHIIDVCRRWNQPTGDCRGCKSDMVGAASATRIRGRTLKSYFKELMVSFIYLYILLCIKFTLSKCLDSVMVLGNSHLAMARTNKLAVIASHCQDRWYIYTLYISPDGKSTVYLT